MAALAPSPPATPDRAARWEAWTRWPLIAASLLFVLVYSWVVVAEPHGSAERIARLAMTATWVVFAADFAVRLTLAHGRARWLRRHLFDLAVVVLPALRPLRLLKAITVVQTLHRTAGAALRSNLAVYGSGAALMLVWIAALAVLDAERDAPGATITSFGDAVWWAVVTITTVGYGDVYPVTLGGRIVAVLLMCGGVAVVGVVTATLASWIIERAAAGRDENETATRGQIRALAATLERIESRLPAAGSEDGHPDRIP